MKILDEVKLKLQIHPEFRERSTRGNYLAILALRRLKVDALNVGIKMDTLAEFADMYATYERAWRQITMKYPELRGSDYKNKKILMEQKQLSLGYGLELA